MGGWPRLRTSSRKFRRRIRCNRSYLSGIQNVHTEDGSDGGQEGAVVAAEWFTSRKRGLLAPFGAGTIDQALLSVLQVCHGFVRLFGLSHKVIVIDEVHAYDAYMTTLLQRLLEWLAALGSPVVLLSATLPMDRRRQLMDAYAKGLGHGEKSTDATLSAPYPRISWVDAAGLPHEQPVDAAKRSRRTLHLVRQEMPSGDQPFDQVSARIADALRDGGCAAVICNTVDRAQKMYIALKQHFPTDDLSLLHSRFLFKDRQDRERQVLDQFGPPDEANTAAGHSRRPERAVLVATQIIEQSLDLDSHGEHAANLLV